MQTRLRKMSQNAYITQLDLSHNKISNHGVRMLNKLLEPGSTLTHLNLANNRVNSDVSCTLRDKQFRLGWALFGSSSEGRQLSYFFEFATEHHRRQRRQYLNREFAYKFFDHATDPVCEQIKI